MPHFKGLPNNSLPYILENLSKQEYNALVRVCKSLYHEVLPYLYRDIMFKATKSRNCSRRLSLLLRTIIEKPQLSAHVNHFKLFGPLHCWSRYNAWPDEDSSLAMNLWGLEGCTNAVESAKNICL